MTHEGGYKGSWTVPFFGLAAILSAPWRRQRNWGSRAITVVFWRTHRYRFPQVGGITGSFRSCPGAFYGVGSVWAGRILCRLRLHPPW